MRNEEVGNGNKRRTKYLLEENKEAKGNVWFTFLLYFVSQDKWRDSEC